MLHHQHNAARSAAPHVTPALLVEKYTLANWVTYMASERGLDAAAVSRLTGIDEDRVKMVFASAVAEMPLSVLQAMVNRL